MSTKDEIRDLQEKIRLQIESGELDKAMADNFSAALKDAGDNAERLASLQKSVNKALADTRSDADYVTKSFRESVFELTKQKNLVKEQSKDLNKLSRTARDLLDIRRGEIAVNDKVLAKKKEEIRLGIRNLEILRDLAQSRGDVEAVSEIESNIKTAKLLYGTYEDIEETVQQTNKDLGAIPQTAAGLDKALQKAGLPALGLSDALEKTHMSAQEAAHTGGDAAESFNAMSVFAGNVKDNIMGALTPANLIQIAFVELTDALIKGDKLTGDLAKNFGMSYEQARDLKSEMTDIANTSGELFVTSEGLVKSFTAINELFGTSVRLSDKLLKDFTILTEQVGLSTEAAGAFVKLQVLTGGEVEDITKDLLGQTEALAAQNGLALNQKQILESIKDVSSATLLILEGQPEAIGEAVVNAKQLGVSLGKVEDIANSLLQFETSISNELEAELLTGKQLNLEKARLAALNGDIATVAEEIAKQTGSAADFAKMNVIQQEALAKAVGMTREGLADALMDREALVKLSAKEGETSQEAFNRLVEEVGMEEAKRRLGDESLANMMEQQSIQERLQASVAKLKEVFVSIAEPILQIVDPIAQLLSDILPGVVTALQPLIYGFKFVGELISGIIGAVVRFKPLLIALGVALAPLALNALITATSFIMSSFSAIPVVGPFLGAAFAVGTFAGLIKTIGGMVKANDLMSPGAGSSGYGNRMLLAPEGAFALNNRDTVIAGTNLNPPPSTSQAMANAEQKRTNALLEQLLTKDQNVYMDSDKVGTAFAKSASF